LLGVRTAMSHIEKKRRLSIQFRALDLEGKTKPVPCVVCPEHADLMTLGSCGRCGAFRRIDFTQEGRPVMTCAAPPSEGIAGSARTKTMQDLLRVPLLCVAEDTKVAVWVPFMGLSDEDDVIPVLDSRARPVGLATFRELQKRLPELDATTATIASLASAATPLLSIDATLAEARATLADTKSSYVFVVAADRTFLGILTAIDLAGTA
jgi:CBS-domain-containing membrane protein